MRRKVTGGPVVNARFRHQRPTGVQVYAREVVARLGPHDVTGPRSPLPAGAGHLWEQAVLPGLVQGRLLFSPANTGPLAVRRQVVTIHDLAALDHPEWFSRSFAAWYGWLLPRLARRVARILTVSEFSRQRLLERFRLPSDQVVVARPGIGPTFQPATEARISDMRHRLGLERPYVLCLGSLDPRKNLAGALAAWRHVTEQQPDLELVVAGGGHGIFRDALSGGLPAGVRATGYVDDSLLAPLYSGAELFVYLAHYEGFGLPPLEAMACGTPVVCSSATALPESAGTAARLVDPLDAVGAADAILALLQDPALRRDMAARGRAHAAAFTWEACAAGVRDVLDQVEAETR